MGSSTENSAFEKTRNPWDLDRVPRIERRLGRRRWPPKRCRRLWERYGGSIRQPAAFSAVPG